MGSFPQQINREIVKVQRVVATEGELQLKSLIEEHFKKTGSEKAEKILNNWDEEVSKFWQVYPPSEAESVFVKEVVKVDQMSVSKRHQMLLYASYLSVVNFLKSKHNV